MFFAVPTSFNVIPLTATSVRASWEFTSSDPLRLGFVIRGFKLLYRLRNSSDKFDTAIIQGNSTFSKNISGLEKYTEYEFEMLTLTANGNGPSSSVLVVRTDEDGEIPVNSNPKIFEIPLLQQLRSLSKEGINDSLNVNTSENVPLLFCNHCPVILSHLAFKI